MGADKNLEIFERNPPIIKPNAHGIIGRADQIALSFKAA